MGVSISRSYELSTITSIGKNAFYQKKISVVILPVMWYNNGKKTCREVTMEYVSVAKMAEKWGISERSVRNYCAHGRIADEKLIGKTWYIP